MVLLFISFTRDKDCTMTLKNNWIEKLLKISQQESRLIIGMMSGTSADSIDAAICKVTAGGIDNPDTSVKLMHFSSFPYPDSIRDKLHIEVSSLRAKDIAELHAEIGEAFAEAALASVQEAGLEPGKIDLIGSHGQTVFHHSGEKSPLLTSLQLGDADRIAERTGCAVISDFRMRDLAAGGEGAPITPYADIILFRGSKKSARRAILNLGGISNITILDSDVNKVTGFDTGPANAPIDRIARILSDGHLSYDKDAGFAKRGKVNDALLEQLLKQDNFLRRTPPKSAGFEIYGDRFVEKTLELHGKADNDLIATVTEYVAISIHDAITNLIKCTPPIEEVVLAGGGSQNPLLVERITEKLSPVRVIMSNELGVPYDAREGMAFALLANDALLGFQTSLPSVTGAKKSVVMGKISLC